MDLLQQRLKYFLLIIIITAFCAITRNVQLSFLYLHMRRVEADHERLIQHLVRCRRLRENVNTRKRKTPVEWQSVQSTTPSWYDTVLPNARPHVWFDHFRMSEELVNKICDIVKGDMSPSEIYVREPIPLKKRVCIALYKLASCSEYRKVAIAFGVSSTSVHRCLYNFCNAMTSKKHEYIKWYTDEDAAAVADITRANYKYPQAIGAIDGSHFEITPPADGMADFLCRKQYPSIVLQAVVDVQYLFRDTYCNTPGSAHDAAVFRRSPLSTMLLQQMPSRDVIIDGKSIPLHLLGDPAYPLSDVIMKGYVGRNLTEEQESFNVYLSKARMCVEIAFGRLKARFRILKKRLDVNVEKAPLVITTCCMLHNILEMNKVVVPAHLLRRMGNEPEEREQPPPIHNMEVQRTAADNRGVIAAYLARTQPLLRPFHL